ncbi:MAG: FAD-binding oxidoreductase [Acidobacteriota bacterium]|nr:FAD-binding oxidoreductase [Acidobacteriota bacterium]
MNLRTPEPYWLLKSGLVNVYPSLQKDLKVDFAIMGGGITGALVAYYLSQAGISVALCDRRHIGMGSTCASTGLLQYEIDKPLFELTEMVGEQHAARSYHLCLESIAKIGELVRKHKIEAEFESKKSFYYASRKKDVPDQIEKEYKIRRKHGIKVELLNGEKIAAMFPFRAPAALLSDTGAQVDAYRLAQGILQASIRNGAQVFDQTEITEIEYQSRGVLLRTEHGATIKAKKLVIANGYESHDYVPFNVIRLHSTYAIVSEPLQQKEIWHQNCLIWETATPYLYMRTTKDRRVLVGGKDETFSSPNKRDKLLTRKTRELVEAFGRKFPDLPLQVDFAWTGTFAETEDGLPYIGSIKQRPHTYFALGFGGNGITFSQVAAEIIRDFAIGKKNNDAKIFTFERSK